MDRDGYVTALALSEVLADLECRLILCGTRSSDEGSSQVPPTVAELMDLPQVTNVIKFELVTGQKKFRAIRRLERGRRELVECRLPALVGVETTIREPNYVSTRAYRQAQRKGIETRTIASFLRPPLDTTPRVRMVGLTPPRPRPKKLRLPNAHMSAAERIKFTMSAGMIQRENSTLLEGQPEKVASRLIEVLRSEAAL
jgi:electron transfer flavoprotein beta subunit